MSGVLRVNVVCISGEVRINGLDIGKRISKIVGYVRQDDIFLGEITVLEHLTFRARLTLFHVTIQ